MIHTAKKYAAVTVEAATEKEAIETAKNIKWEEFDERETADATSWEVRDARKWYEILLSIFQGR